MNTLFWKPLEERRAVNKLKLFHKARLKQIKIPLDHFTQQKSKRNGGYAIPASNVDAHLYSFYPNTIRLWNSLPEEGKSFTSFNTFKNYLDKITVRSTYNI